MTAPQCLVMVLVRKATHLFSRCDRSTLQLCNVIYLRLNSGSDSLSLLSLSLTVCQFIVLLQLMTGWALDVQYLQLLPWCAS